MSRCLISRLLGFGLVRRVENEFGIEAENGWHLARIGTQIEVTSDIDGFADTSFSLRSAPYQV